MRPGVRKCRRLLCPPVPAGILFLRCQISSPSVVNLQPLEKPFEVCSLRSFDGGSSLDFGPAPRGAFFGANRAAFFSVSGARCAVSGRPIAISEREMRRSRGRPCITEKSHNAVKQRATRSEILPAGRCKLGRVRLHEGPVSAALALWLSSQELGMVLGRGLRQVGHPLALFGCDPVQGVSTAGSIHARLLSAHANTLLIRRIFDHATRIRSPVGQIKSRYDQHRDSRGGDYECAGSRVR
jgi:hypothetical protein